MGIQQHSANHDLESIFYVLIYALTIFKGPDSMRKQADYNELSSIPVLDWFRVQSLGHSFRDMARMRMGHLADFEGSIVKKMHNFFRPLFPFLNNLFLNFFPDRDYLRNQMNHLKMIELFNAEYDKLKAMEENQMTDGSPKGKKRHID